jgi:hypothetical protein
LSSWAQHDWQLFRVDVETFDQYFRGCVDLGLEQLVGMTIAPAKTFKPLQHITVLGAT